ncbi:unnamed protein product, partial [Rodentolepis nana]|uniref:Uncharacterized protein n=1 Tax=Rodentolepis nana TaxID=102285 RepID=A0A0R3TFB8_RODNA
MLNKKPQRGHRRDETCPHTMRRLQESKNEVGIHTPTCLLLLTHQALPEILRDIAKIVSKYENERRYVEIQKLKKKKKESAPVENECGSFFWSFVQFVRDELSWYGSDESENSINESHCDDFGYTSFRIIDYSNCASKEMGDGNDELDLVEECGECASSKEEAVTNIAAREIQCDDQKTLKVRTCDFSHGPLIVNCPFEEAQSENNEHESFCTINRKRQLNYSGHSIDGNVSHGFKRARGCIRKKSPQCSCGNLLTCVESSKRVNGNRVHFNDDVECISNSSNSYNYEHQLPHSCDFSQIEVESSMGNDERCTGANGFEGCDGECLALLSKVDLKERRPH